MQKMKNTWADRTRTNPTGRRLILKGTAYPDVTPHMKTKVQSSSKTGRKYYHDGAVQLSEKNLNDIKGAVDAPICFNHDIKDVVGKVEWSWLRPDADGRQPLEIIASLPLDTNGRVYNSKGVDVRREIEEKRLRAFSVRYITKLDDDDNVTEKLFQEISLVPQPFFDGCNLTMSVVAGQNQGNNGKLIQKYIESNTNNLFAAEIIPFTMSEEQQPLAAAPQTPAQESTDLLRQTDLLATQNKEYAARLAEMERKFQEAENAKKLYAASMVETAKPQFDRYKQYWEKTQGKTMPENLAQAYLATFVDPSQKDAKAIIVKEMEEAEKAQQQSISVAASLAELKKELDAVKAERMKLEETVSKATEAPSTRATYARALDAQQQHTQELSTAAGAAIPEGEIPVPPPCNSMLPFLQAAGRCVTSSNQLGVTAGADGLLPLLRSVPAPPTHDQLVGKDGKLNFPFSLRYSDTAAFSYMTHGPLATAPTEVLESISAPIRSKSIYDAKYTHEAKFLE